MRITKKYLTIAGIVTAGIITAALYPVFFPSTPPAPIPTINETAKSLSPQQVRETLAKLAGEIEALVPEAEKSGDDAKLAELYTQLAKLHESYKNNKGAVENYEKLAKLMIKGERFLQAADVYNKIGFLYMYERIPATAVEYYKKALALNEQVQDKTAIARSYHNLGQAYMLAGNPEESSNHFMKAANLQKELKDWPALAHTSNALSLLYHTGKRYEEAESFQAMSLKLNTKLDRKDDIVDNYQNFAMIFKDKGDRENACKSWSEAYKLLGHPDMIQKSNNVNLRNTISETMRINECDSSAAGGFGLQ